MTIPEKDSKILWARAAGICSRPGCFTELTRLVASGAYTVGEMAHVIAEAKDGPRGDGVGGNNTYSNLILLCPTCHTHVDKAPAGEFPEEELLEWKVSHEKRVASLVGSDLYDRSALNKLITQLLADNHRAWLQYGPESKMARESPNSNAHELWKNRIDTVILPNNQRVTHLLGRHLSLFRDDELPLIRDFFEHADSYRLHRDEKLDQYPKFPTRFPGIFQ